MVAKIRKTTLTTFQTWLHNFSYNSTNLTNKQNEQKNSEEKGEIIYQFLPHKQMSKSLGKICVCFCFVLLSIELPQDFSVSSPIFLRAILMLMIMGNPVITKVSGNFSAQATDLAECKLQGESWNPKNRAFLFQKFDSMKADPSPVSCLHFNGARGKKVGISKFIFGALFSFLNRTVSLRFMKSIPDQTKIQLMSSPENSWQNNNHLKNTKIVGALV